MLRDTQNVPSFWLNIIPILEKLLQEVVTRNRQANLQPTLNKGPGGATLTNFATNCVNSKIVVTVKAIGKA